MPLVIVAVAGLVGLIVGSGLNWFIDLYVWGGGPATFSMRSHVTCDACWGPQRLRLYVPLFGPLLAPRCSDGHRVARRYWWMAPVCGAVYGLLMWRLAGQAATSHASPLTLLAND